MGFFTSPILVTASYISAMLASFMPDFITACHTVPHTLHSVNNSQTMFPPSLV